MAVTNKSKDQLTSIFEDVLNRDDIEVGFKVYLPQVHETIVKEALLDFGFPSDVDIQKVNYDFKVKNKIELEDWADQFISEKGLDEETTIEVGHDEVELFVLDHIENISVQITVKDELKEWIESHPTVEYMEEAIESNYNSLEMVSFLKRNNYTSLQKIEEACIESNIPKEEAKNVDYEIKNLRIKTPISALAEVYAEEVNDSNTTTQIYLDNNLYENLITEVEYDINILSNPEDF